MTTDRAHAAEDQYFRDQEADREREAGWELQRVACAERARQEEIEARLARQAAHAATLAPHASRDARRGLNRLVVAGFGELLALEEAARSVPSLGGQLRLKQKAERRRVFLSDLSRAVVALGGVPAKRASLFALGAAGARGLRRLLTGPHQGDAYAACSKASARTVSKYPRALRLSLAEDVRFGVERQYAELGADSVELRRLRWM
jgi:hypothetical protein